jgi:SAM-dependent methyltransferase
MLPLRFPAGSFDAVVCVFGIFFVPDMAMAVNELWRRVRPGGRLAVATWGLDLFEPGNNVFWRSIMDVRPDLYKGFDPWDRIDNPVSLKRIFDQAGVASANIVSEDRLHSIRSGDDWWAIVLGSGYRGTVEQLNRAEWETVKESKLSFYSG